MLIYWVNEWMMNELCIILLVWHIEVQNNGWLTWIKIKYHRASTASLLSLVKLCKPMDCRPPGSSVHGILQVRILEWVAIPFSRVSSWPRVQTQVSFIAGRFFTIWATKEDVYIGFLSPLSPFSPCLASAPWSHLPYQLPTHKHF